MRWQALFADLEAQLASARQAELEGEVADRSRREVAALRLADRLRAARGVPLTFGVPGLGSLPGRVAAVGADWLLVGAAPADVLVPLAAVAWVGGLPADAAPGAAPAVMSRLGLGYALRGISRDRSAVTLVLRDGARLAGTIDRVGADFLDLAEHPPDEPRRHDVVVAVRTVPFAGLAAVRPA